MPRDKTPQSRIALIYDFDSTLTPLAMQEYTVLPTLGIEGAHFWNQVSEETKTHKSDRMLTWMRLMLEKAEVSKTHLDERTLKKLASGLKYFEGVATWFGRINAYVKKHAPSYITIDHYLISAGLEEILNGCSIKKHFRQIYASRYYYNHHGVATFPAVLVNDTMKTQFLFRINKGKEDLSEDINEHMSENDRAVPFRNMIYIGDGLSDVPSMTVTKKNGGFAVAVHDDTPKSLITCQKLLLAKRVDYYAKADYRGGKELEQYIRNLLDLIIADVKNRHAIEGGKSRIPGNRS